PVVLPPQGGKGAALLLLALLGAPALAFGEPPSAQLEAMRSKLVRLGADQANGEGQAAGARARLASLNGQEQGLAAEIAANRVQLTHLLSALQLMTRDPPPPLVVSPRRANDAVRAAILMRAVEPELKKRADALADQGRRIAKLRRLAAMQNESLM